tara:strand:+ start:2329 stop:3120 length:792 start_codon:yes stop_codon:yes gene_type:complete
MRISPNARQRKEKILITGGASGIGAATARFLADEGYVPIVVDIASGTSHDDSSEGILVWPDSVDVTDEAAVENAVAQIEAQHGPIEGLVNAAGILGKMHTPDRLAMSDWDHEIAVDLRGTFLTCRAVGSRMAQRRAGAIVNIASVAGMSSGPLHGYAPAKAAVINLTATLAAEWGPHGVRVNAVSPGFTNTKALQAGIASGVLSAEQLTDVAAMRRLVEPHEIASTVSWLLGPGASAVTGANIPVDAGFICGTTWQAYGGLRK